MPQQSDMGGIPQNPKTFIGCAIPVYSYVHKGAGITSISAPILDMALYTSLRITWCFRDVGGAGSNYYIYFGIPGSAVDTTNGNYDDIVFTFSNGSTASSYINGPYLGDTTANGMNTGQADLQIDSDGFAEMLWQGRRNTTSNLTKRQGTIVWRTAGQINMLQPTSDVAGALGADSYFHVIGFLRG